MGKTRLEVAISMHRSGDHQQAELMYREIVKDGNSDFYEASRHLAILFFQRRDYKNAVAISSSLMGGFAPDEGLLFLLARAEFEMGAYAESEAHLAMAMAVGLDKRKAVFWRAMIACRCNDLYKAEQLFREGRGALNTGESEQLQYEIKELKNRSLDSSERKSQGVYSDMPIKRQETEEATYKQASEAAQQKRWPLALSLYNKVLKKKKNPRYMSEKALVLLRLKHKDQAISLGRSAWLRAKNDAGVLSNYGLILYETKRFDESLLRLNEALELKVDYSPALVNICSVHIALGNYVDGAAAARHAISIIGATSKLCNNLAVCLTYLNKLEEAETAGQLAIELDVCNENAYVTLSRVYIAKDNFDKAEMVACQGLSTLPRSAWLHAFTAEISERRGESATAILRAKTALNLDSDVLRVAGTAGYVFVKLGLYEEVIEALGRFIDFADEELAVLSIYASALANLKRTDEAISYYRKALSISPGYAKIRSQLLFHLAYQNLVSSESYFSEAVQYYTHLPQISTNDLVEVEKTRISSKASTIKGIRIGFLSGDLRKHSVGYFIPSLIIGLKKLGVETYAYSTYTEESDEQSRFRKIFSYWRDVEELDNLTLANLIASDRIDILLELSGHTDGNRLQATRYRPAPLICHYLGYIATTGMSSIDYFICDRYLVDPQAQGWFSEKLLVLDRGYAAYNPPSDAPEPLFDKSLYGENVGTVYGCFNNARKYSHESIQCWAQILSTDRDSCLVLKSRNLASEDLRTNLVKQFASEGIGSNRIVFDHTMYDRASHFNRYNGIHCALDPIGFTGATTTCDTIWMGVPVITLPGSSLKERLSASMLQSAGLDEFISTSREDYITKAIAAGSRAKHDMLKKVRIRETVAQSDLLDGESLASEILAKLSPLLAD